MQPVESDIDEVIALYYGEWVLLRVTAYDEHHDPARGYVICHSVNRGDLSAALKREPLRHEIAPGQRPQPYYTFKAYPRLHVGETHDEAVSRFAAQRAAISPAARVQQ